MTKISLFLWGVLWAFVGVLGYYIWTLPTPVEKKCGNHLDLFNVDGERLGTFSNVKEFKQWGDGHTSFSTGNVFFQWKGTYLYYEVCDDSLPKT